MASSWPEPWQASLARTLGLWASEKGLARYFGSSLKGEAHVDWGELLAKLLLQDVERLPEGVATRQGVSRDRVISVHDPEMRHGHQSKTRRRNGHKMAVAGRHGESDDYRGRCLARECAW